MLVDDIINQRQSSTDAPDGSKPRPKRFRWLRRIFVGLLLVLGVGFCAFYGFAQSKRSNPPFSLAFEMISSDAQVIEQLGEPIKNVRWLPSGNYPQNFNIRVRGPQGEADVLISARQFDDEWALTSMNVTILDGGETFSIDTSESGPSSADAPAFNPGGAATDGGTDIDLPDVSSGINIDLPDDSSGISIDLPEDSSGITIEFPDMPTSPEQ
jgi:hypothetical protein